MTPIGIGVFQVLPDLSTGDPGVIARKAEDLGFESYWVPDHPVIPVGSTDDYPGKERGERPPEYLFKIPDPLVALARASTATSKIRLGTSILLVPQRNAIATAMQIASLDHYCRGRFVLGIGAGWNEPECTVMGGDFPHRWTQTRHSILAMKQLWTQREAEYHSEYVDFDPVIAEPKPTRKPHPPVLLGSNTNPRVFKRVAEWGDGWLPYTSDPQELADGKAAIGRHAAAVGRDPRSLEVTMFSPTGLFRTKSELSQLEKAGADNVVIWLQGSDEAELISELEDLAGALL